MSVTRHRGRVLLLSISAAALGVGLAVPASADDFNPQPDPPGKPIAVENLQRFVPPDPIRQAAAIQAHQRVIAKLGGVNTPPDIP